MEAALISALEVLEDSLAGKLSAFVSQYFTLPPSAVVERARLTELLMDRLHCPDGAWTHWTTETLDLALQVLRIIARQVEGCSLVFCRTGIETLLKHSKLHPECTYVESPITIGALKILGNVLLLDMTMKRYFDEFQTGKYLKQALMTRLSMEGRFSLFRLLFLLTIHRDEVVRSLNEDNVAQAIIQNLQDATPIAVKDILTKPQPWEPVQGLISQATPLNSLTEVLKCVYNLTVGMAPRIYETAGFMGFSMPSNNEDTVQGNDSALPAYVKTYLPLITPLSNILLQFPYSKVPLSSPHSNAINVLMNMPIDSESREYWFPEKSHILVERLLTILETTVMDSFPSHLDTNGVDDMKLNPMVAGIPFDEAISPLLLVLIHLAKKDIISRQMIKKKVMPEDIDRSHALDKGRHFVNRLISFMTSILYSHTKELVCELMFVCSDENPKQMTAYCGYGHVAGYLMGKGVIVPQDGFKEPELEERPVDPITGEYAKEKEDPWAGMSEEDKEREAEKLFVLFDRLQKTGVVKMVRPGEIKD